MVLVLVAVLTKVTSSVCKPLYTSEVPKSELFRIKTTIFGDVLRGCVFVFRTRHKDRWISLTKGHSNLDLLYKDV